MLLELVHDARVVLGCNLPRLLLKDGQWFTFKALLLLLHHSLLQLGGHLTIVHTDAQ